MHVFAFLFALLGSSGVASAQRTWVVDWLNRPGTDFTAIQPAVDAAAPGDIIRVRAAGLVPPVATGHAYPAPVIDGKGVVVVGEGPTTTWLEGSLSISNLPPGQSVTLAGFYFGLGSFSNPLTSEIVGDQNRGSIKIQHVTFGGFAHSRPIDNSDLIVISHCTMKQWNGPWASRSNLMLDDVVTVYDPYWTFPGTPLVVDRCRVWITNSYLEGQTEVFQNGNYSPAIDTTDSDVWIGPGTELRGGVSRNGFQTPITDHWAGSPDCVSVVYVPGSRVHVDPRAQLIGTWPPAGCMAIRPHRISAVWVAAAGGVLTVNQRCSPSSLTVLGAGPFLPSPATGPPGLLAIDANLSLLWWAFAPATGDLLWQLPIPSNLPFGFEVGLQAIELTQQGSLELSNSTIFGNW